MTFNHHHKGSSPLDLKKISTTIGSVTMGGGNSLPYYSFISTFWVAIYKKIVIEIGY